MKKPVNLLFFIVAVVIGSTIHGQRIENPEYIIYVDEITRQFEKEMKQMFNLTPYGSGGSMPFDVQKISVDFISYTKANIDEARTFEVKATERLLELINSHEKIRPFLREYPFPSSRACILISFRKRNQAHQKTDSVSLVCRGRNGIVYNTINPSTELFDINLEEPYEEALKIVKGSE